MSKKMLQAAAGNAGESLYVEDVFSTYLFTGTGTTNNIVNGIDLDGEGGLVWLKNREGADSHGLFDTERGVRDLLRSDTIDASVLLSTGDGLTAFNSDGFTLGDGVLGINTSGIDNASWTFRKAEKFFDVVTYTGTGTPQTVSHNLGVAPAFIITKKTSGTSNWATNDPSQANPWSGALLLNSSNAFTTTSTVWNNTAPTDSVFTVGTADATNVSGQTYVAYLFASDAGGFGDDGDESIIKCGSYVGNGTSSNYIDFGFEPQWLLVKNTTTGSTPWLMLDNMRGWFAAPASSQQELIANTSNAESTGSNVGITSTGIGITTSATPINKSGDNYIYIAIRRPMKTPESGTEVFALQTQTPSGSDYVMADSSGFPIDWLITRRPNLTSNWFTTNRLTKNYLIPNTTDAQGTYSYGFDLMEGVSAVWNASLTNSFAFKRATGFFDVVAYTGNGTAGRTVAHNLGVVPELMIVKQRPYSSSWTVYNKDIGAANKLVLNSTAALASATSAWNSTAPTSSVFTLGSLNDTNENPLGHIAYLFATLAGVSKVGSYTGTGSNVDVDCGFSAGARFILIKRTNSTGDWYVYDSLRGIVAGNDPYLLLNSSAAQVTNTDYIDPLARGFTVTSSGGNELNDNGSTYIFLAIA